MFLSKIRFLFVFTITSCCWSNQKGLDKLEEDLMYELTCQKSTLNAINRAEKIVVIPLYLCAGIACMYARSSSDTSKKKAAEKNLYFAAKLGLISLLLKYAYNAYADSQIKQKEATLNAIHEFRAANTSENKPLDLQSFYHAMLKKDAIVK